MLSSAVIVSMSRKMRHMCYAIVRASMRKPRVREGRSDPAIAGPKRPGKARFALYFAVAVSRGQSTKVFSPSASAEKGPTVTALGSRAAPKKSTVTLGAGNE